MNKHYYAVIMAGGIGSRFWPMSRQKKPKQFLDIMGVGKTLIQITYERLCHCVLKENIWVVTHQDYAELMHEQLSDIGFNRILFEPERKNTAPCIAYVSEIIHSLDPEGVMLIAPSDHLILNESQFIDDIRESFEYVSQSDKLLTLGIQASRPDTGYGYIHFDQDIYKEDPIFSVKQFVEKPSYNIALQYIKSGDYLWNSGMFLWRADAILKEFKRLKPEIYSLFNNIQNKNIVQVYKEVESISIDFAILEHAKQVYVRTVNFGWSDLGTWGSLYHLSEQDNSGNVIHADKILLDEVQDCIIKNNTNKFIAIQGLKDFIVINTEDVLLICDKMNEQKIKDITNQLGTQAHNTNLL